MYLSVDLAFGYDIGEYYQARLRLGKAFKPILPFESITIANVTVATVSACLRG